MSDKLDTTNVAFFAGSIVAGALAAHFGQPWIHNNTDAINLIATIFSVLAGLLIGIVTLLADPGLLPGQSWRGAFLGKKVLRRRLNRHRILFVIYLVTLSLILTSAIVKGAAAVLVEWIERAYLFFGTIGLLYSFRLPWSLARIQEERLEAAVKAKRRDAGLKE